MVGVGGLAGWFAAGELSWGTLAFFVLLVLWRRLDGTFSNDLADVEHDRLVGSPPWPQCEAPRPRRGP